MKGLNKVMLIGNLGNESEVKTLEAGIKVAKLSLAVTESYKDDKGQTYSETEGITVILWRSLAEIAEKYMHKGSLVHIEGKLKTRSYDDKAGGKRYVSEVIGEQIILLDKKISKE